MMSKNVFLSFHYAPDASRVQQIRNMGAIEGDSVVSPQKWEDVKAGGEAAIEKWIHDEMLYKQAVVVLVGAETASRKWVTYEICKAWNEKRPLVGIRINGLLDLNGNTSTAGENPFASIKTKDGKPLSNWVPLHTPFGTDSKAKYADIKANFESWVTNAYKRS